MTIVDIMHTHLHFKVKGNLRNLHPTTMPLWSLLKGIRENRALADLTAHGRTLDPQVFKEWKPKNLMSVYFAVKFRNPEGRADEDNVCGYTGLAGFDFDDVDVGGALDCLYGFPEVVCAGVSASGKGVWCAAHVAAATAQEYMRAFAAGIETFQAAGMKGMDVGAHDPTRARFVAYSPESWWRWDAEGDIPAFQPVGDISVLSARKSKKAKVALPEGYVTSPELALDEVRAVLNEADGVADGDRNTEKARQCGRIKAIAAKAGVNPAAYVAPFVAKWDAVGSTHKKTMSMVNRLLLRIEKDSKKG